MSIEIGSKWIKDGEVVEVTNFYESVSIWCIWFIDSKTISHILTERDFLEQYKPYEEPKQTVVIEKWLCKGKQCIDGSTYLHIVETSNIDAYVMAWDNHKKIKLLDTYEVTL